MAPGCQGYQVPLFNFRPYAVLSLTVAQQLHDRADSLTILRRHRLESVHTEENSETNAPRMDMFVLDPNG
jgi:hypothetical protein